MAETEKLLKWVPIVALVFTIGGTAAVSQFQINANAEEVKDLSQSVDEIEDEVDMIKERLLREQGQVKLDIQKIQIEQKSQGDDLNQILRLLQDQSRDR